MATQSRVPQIEAHSDGRSDRHRYEDKGREQTPETRDDICHRAIAIRLQNGLSALQRGGLAVVNLNVQQETLLA